MYVGLGVMLYIFRAILNAYVLFLLGGKNQVEKTTLGPAKLHSFFALIKDTMMVSFRVMLKFLICKLYSG